jgi:DNA-binding NarL/FixJ family response regulator
MPEMDGVAAITAVRAEFPDACFIMLTIYDGDEAIFQGFRAGAKAYLLKDTPCDEIADVIREVCRGERHISSEIGKKLAARIELPALSDRECQVLKLVSNGKNNKGQAVGEVKMAQSTKYVSMELTFGNGSIADGGSFTNI